MADIEGKKTGGRAKGVANKITQELFDVAERLECNPFEVLLHYAKGDFEALGYEEYQIMVTKTGETVTVLTIDPALRQKSAKDACEYLFPKRKAIEHTGKDGEKLFSYEDYLNMLEKRDERPN